MEKNPTTSFWVKFFIDAGIPNSAAANYAIVFAENRIQTDMLLDLNKEYLRDMGITVLGDVIAILKHSKAYHEKIARDKVLFSDKILTQKKAPATQIIVDQLPREAGSGTITIGPPKKNLVTLKPVVQAVKATPVKIAKLTETAPKRVEVEVLNEEVHGLNLNPPTKRKIAQPIDSKIQIKREVPAEKTTVLKTSTEKSSIFQRLGESTVTSTTPESEQKSSIFNRLGTKTPQPGSVTKTVPGSLPARKTLVATRMIKLPKDSDKPTLKSDLESLSQKQTARERLGLSTEKPATVKKTITSLVQASPITKRVVRPPVTGQNTGTKVRSLVMDKTVPKSKTSVSAVKTRLGPSSIDLSGKTSRSVFSRLGMGN